MQSFLGSHRLNAGNSLTNTLLRFENQVLFKTLARIAVAALLAMGLTPQAAQATGCSLSGVGDAQNPYELDTATDFDAMAICDGAGKYFILTHDIDFGGLHFGPHALLGHLDGHGHSISGFVSEVSQDISGDVDRGFFSRLEAGSSVKSLSLTGVVSGSERAGVLAGYAIDSLISEVLVMSSRVQSEGIAGGLVGTALNTELEEVVVSDTWVRGKAGVGGVVGVWDASSLTTLGPMYFDDANIHLETNAETSIRALGSLVGQLTVGSESYFVDSGSTFAVLISTAPNLVGVAVGGLVGKVNTTAASSSLSFVRTFQEENHISLFTELNGEYPADVVNVPSAYIGEIETASDNDPMSIFIQDSYSVVRMPDENSNSRFFYLTKFDNTVNGSVQVDNLHVWTGYTDTELVLPAATVKQESLVEFSHIKYYQRAGFGVYQPLDNDDLMGAYDFYWYFAPFFDQNMPVPAWLFFRGWIDPSSNARYPDLNFAMSPPEPGPSSYNNYSIQGESWIDVAAEDRIYLETFTTNNPRIDSSYDDRQFQYIPAGIACDNSYQLITAEQNRNGIFLIGRPDRNPALSGISCYQGDDLYDYTGDDFPGAFDIGFDVPLGDENVRYIYPQTNGRLDLSQDDASYSGSMFESTLTEMGGFAPLGLDQVYFQQNSAFYAAKIQLNGQRATVFSWENMSPYFVAPELNWVDEPQTQQLASFQVVFQEKANGHVEVWYNYDRFSFIAEDVEGDALPYFTIDAAKDVNPGTNLINVGEQRLQGTGCFSANVSGYLGIDGTSSITDTSWLTLPTNEENYISILYFSQLEAESNQLALYLDDTCTTELIISERQNVERDGVVHLSIHADSAVRGVPIGFAKKPHTDGTIPYHFEFFQNVPLAELVDGGDSELISTSIGTDVPGRVAYNLGLPIPTNTGGGATSYSGPIISVTGITAKAGETITVKGTNLSTVKSAIIENKQVPVTAQESSIQFTVPEDLAAGKYSLKLVSSYGTLQLGEILQIVDQRVNVEPLVATSVKRLGNSVRIAAFDLVGVGKVQYFLNGKEIAWVNVSDETNPKLRKRGSSNYFVRSLALAAGKNVIEIQVSGERIRRVSYTR